MHGLLEAIWELLLVDLEVLGVLGLLVRQAVVLAGRVEGRHELMDGLGRTRWAGKVRATGHTGGHPVFIIPLEPGNRGFGPTPAAAAPGPPGTRSVAGVSACPRTATTQYSVLSTDPAMQEPIHPPVSYEDFSFALDPAVSNVFPSPPPLPSSADLFSPSETTDLLGFLDTFGFDVDDIYAPLPLPERQHDIDGFPPEQDVPMTLQSALDMSMADKGKGVVRGTPAQAQAQPGKSQSTRPSRSSRKASAATAAPAVLAQPAAASAEIDDGKPKQLLSTPQKRLNHIMSEQKRRNAIRDGYVQLTALLAPAGAPPGTGMPTRGRPKGSGTRGNGRGGGRGGFKGKSGILFRAVEYIHWLEEGRGALVEEVLKVEAAAGIHHS